MSVLYREEREAIEQLPREEIFSNVKEGRVAAHIEGLQALFYARRFGLQAEAMADIMAFHNAVTSFSERDFSQLKITRTPVGSTGCTRVEVSIQTWSGWDKAAYTCLSAI
ncbi:hypothetical protein [Ralstonia phage RP12]|uniref:Uncharacterized protein n=1 Tax=Ralstonia phage RP12 TaxID=1923889 RepID=A0A1L7N0T6_9CAUD|nr:hypothetical protein FDH28_gp108 [Ralstonia phage RP12]BAW19082.1 hypothetical protein [Ralstonia phage RP12]